MVQQRSYSPACAISRAITWSFKMAAIVLLCQVVGAFSNGLDVVGCGGFVQSDVEINYSLIEVKLYTKQGTMKYRTDCAPNNGYFLIPLYDKGVFVLKVEPPSGWSFEPSSVELVIDGTTDKCSKGQDINFVFTGFSLSGKVLSKGRDQGPSGVDITLKTKDLERKTVTTESGLFSFTRVMPASYQVIASHPTWKFQKSVAEVAVAGGNVDVEDKLVVAGYDVKGHVLNDGRPIQGVNFLLFSKTVAAKDVLECEAISDDILGTIKKSEDSPLCSVKSGADGVFVFLGVPSGEYSLIPFYKGEHITFDVVPAKLTFSVNFKSVVLKTPFQVHGFSVSGRVISTEGSGIGGTSVGIGGSKSVLTSVEGVYVVDNITTGTYAIQASKANYYFEPVTVHINPNTPRLPDIKPSGYNLCGTVSIEEFPPGVAQVTGRRVTLQTEGAPIATRSMSATLDKSGNFCFKVTPGTHHVQPVVTGEESAEGLVLKPTEVVVKVENSPVLDLKFTQFRATVSGVVKCIGGTCGEISLSLSSMVHSDTPKRVTQVSNIDSTSVFSFKNVLPGKYKAFVLQDSWCWQNKSLEFTVVDADVADLEFVQSGYILKCSLSHSITLNFSLETGKEVVGSFNLTKGVNRFCLAEPGVYNLVPNSCHKFEQNVYKYDTSSPTVLTLSAVKHQLLGRILALTSVKDTKVTVRSLKTNEATVYEPLLLPDKPKEKKPVNETKRDVQEAKEKVEKDNFFNFSHWGRNGEEFEVTPRSSELLFYPSRKTVTVADGCPGAVVEFEGRLGVFLEGQISPPLKEVKITITTLDDKSELIHILTDDKGQYRVGPLDSGVEYDMAASKDGYVLNAISGKRGHFQASKLGQIDIQVTDMDGTPLAGVLLSLSAGQFRSNNVTFDNGSMSFTNLSPGQYFFRPMLKEYTFSPASQMVNVAEGTTVTIAVKGKRVAFSCYGIITSLNGEPEKGVVVEASGLNSCEGMQEETRTDEDGSYRLRGLQPGCTYRVRVKTGESNPHVERASPSFIDIQVPTNDIENVNIIAFRRHNQFDVTGNVVTDNEFISSLKVLMYRENNLDSPVQTTTVGIASFFQFPPVPNDGKIYVIRLVSSLSSKVFELHAPEATISAAGRKTHVTFHFKPTRRTFEQEHSQGSLLALPLLILLAVVAFNHTKVLPVLQQGVQMMQGLPTDQLQVPVGGEYDPIKAKRKPQIRKR